MTITKRQREVFNFIREWQLEKKYSPSLNDIACYLGYQSKGTPLKHVNALCAAGLLVKSPIGTIKMIPTGKPWTPFNAPTLSMGRCYLKLHAFPEA